MYQSIPQTPSHTRVFTACLLSFMMLMAPIASVAAATIRATEPAVNKTTKKQLSATERLEAALFEPALPVIGPVITATKVDSFPSHPSGQAEPGDAITYDINVSNAGADATGVQFTDTIDPNTTLVPGSLKVSPLAFADAYVAEKDVALSVSAPGVLTNDTGTPAPTAVPIAAGPTTQGGTVTLNADGSFNYTPPAAFTGSDTFTYTATNGLTPNDTATVTITVDARPAVTTTTPTNSATNQATNINIVVNFSEAVNATTSSFTIECPAPGNLQPFAVSGSGTGTITLDPTADLPAGTTCKVTVIANQISDTDTNDPPDNLSADFIFSFTTDAAPSVSTTTPTNGATGVAANTNIVVNFSEAVNATTSSFTIECPAPGNLKTFTVSGSGTSAITLDPTVDLPVGTTCTVTVIAAQIHDSDANDPPDTMAANYVFSFTIDAPPSVSSTVPTDTATGVATNTTITVNFSESVNATTSSFTIKCPSGGAALPYTLSSSPSTSFTLTPNAALPAGTTCQVTVIAAQITDVDTADPPDQMVTNFVFNFTTDAAPTVTTTVPTNGANPVATNTNITVNFSEPVNATISSFTIECPAVGNLQAFTVTGSGTSTITLDPTADLPVGTVCTVTVIANQITDTDTNDPPDNMAANFVFSFTTDQAPSVTTTVPINGATNVALNATITVNFSENVAATGSSFTIVCTNAGSRAFTLSASPSTSFTLTPTGGLPAGDDCTVTVIANQISDTDTADPPDNMVTNFVFSFKVQPDAVNDTYPVTLVGNVSTNSFLLPYSVTTNDVSAAAFTISAVQANSTVVTNTITTTSTNGGNIVMTVSGTDRGKFTYDPPAGFEGTDTFTYTISRTDGGGADTATVSMPVSGMVWFINNAASSCTVAGCGRLSNPFSTLAVFNTLNNGTGNNPAANDNIFIYTGSGNYTAPLTLLNNQRVIGQGATSSLSTLTGLTPPTGSPALPATGGTDPTITSGGIGFSLASGNQLYGLKFLSTTGTAINGGVNVGTLILGDIIVDNSATSGAGIILNNGGTSVTSSGINTINTGAAQALNLTNATIGGAGLTFRSISVNGATNGIVLNNTGATAGLTVTGQSTTAGSGGTIQNTTSSGVKVTTSINLSLSNMNLTNDGTAQTVAGSSTQCGGDLRTGNNLSCVAGLFMQTITGASLTNLSITSGNQMGIVGNDVTTFTMANSTVTGNGDEAFEDGLIFQNLKGTSSITNSIIKNNATRQIHVANTTNSSTLTLGITGTRTNNAYPTMDTSTTMIGNDASGGANTQQGILFETNTTGTLISMTLNINGVVFNNNLPQNAVDIQPIAASATLGGTTQNSSFDTNAGGVIISMQNGSGGTYNLLNNEFNRTNLQSILYSAANPTSGTLIGTIQGNTIGTSGQSGSACVMPNGVAGASNCTGIDVNFIGGTGAIQLKIGGTGGGQGNTVQQFDGDGIRLKGNGAGSLQASIKNNTVQNPLNLVAHGIETNVGTTAGATVNGCFDITGNTVTGTYEDPCGGCQLKVVTNVRFSSTHNLPGYGGSGTDTTAVLNFILANNPLILPPSGLAQRSAPGVYAGGSCTTPLMLADGGVESAWNSSSLATNFMNAAFNSRSLITDSSWSEATANDITFTRPSALGSVTQRQLDSIVGAATERWTATGLTSQQIATLRSINFNVADLKGGYLGEADGNRILVDRDAGGQGWFIDSTPQDDSEFATISSTTRRYTDPFSEPTGHVDLLTAIEHEIGHKLGLDDSYLEKDRDSIMYGYLTVGERRVPAPGQARGVNPNALSGPHYLSLPSEVRGQRSEVRDQRSEVGGRRSEVGHSAIAPTTAPLAPPPPPTISQSIGTLKGGKTVHIQFQVTVNTPFPGGTTQVSNQGTVTFNEPGSPVLTDDPAVAGTSDPTVTPVSGNLSLIVNTLGDAADLSLDGTCDSNAAAGSQCTLRAAIQEANNAATDDVITFDPALNGGTITLDTALDAISGNLTITGPGASMLTVQRNDGAATFFRIFTINSGNTVTISGLTITKGNLSSGNGGAVLNNGTLTLSNCNLYNNSTTNNGGGIYNDGPSLTLNSCNVGGGPPLGQPNLAISGGGIFNNSGTLLMTGGSIGSNNRGGIFIQSGTVTLNGVTIRDNVINGSGGGVSSAGGLTNISNCLLTNNHALRGGGVFNNGATVTVVNSTISGNDATLEGGGVHNQSGTTTLTNATITNNRSDFDNVGAQPGGGIFSAAAGTLTLNNTIVSSNFRGTGLTLDDVNGAVDPASLNNLIGDGTGMTGISNGVNGNHVGTAGAPINARVAALVNNGGPTQTHALLAGSPALDAGDNTTATNAGLTTDQRGTGFARIVDGPDADTTPTVDIGAFEAQVSLPDLADQIINEDGSLTLPFDVGGGAGIVSVTATSSNTTLVPNLAVNIDVTGAGSSRTLTINPVADGFGTSTITVTVTGANSQTMTDTFLLTVNSVNDTPSFTKGPDQNVAEDAGPQTVTNWATGISAGAANESGQTLTFLVTNNTNSALFSAQPAISSTGTLTYTPAANASGSAAITIVLMDNGGGADTSAPQIFNIVVNSSNDAPVNTVPGAQSVAENSSLTFSAANGNAISIADIDAGTNAVQVQLTATNGTITLSSISGLSFTVGDGTADATMTFTGTIANINAALNGLVFTPTAGFNGAASLQIATNDQGNTGSGGALSDTDTVNITVNDGGTLQFSAATYSVSENVGNATITITRTGGTAGTATVQFSTATGGTATAGSDYTAVTNQTVTFNDGDTSKTVDVPISNDSLDENDETVNLTLSSAGGSGALGAPATAVLTINDDDATPSLSINDVSLAEGNSGTTTFTFTVTLSAASGLPVTVNYATANGTADASDYTAVPSTLLTFNAGDTSKTLDVLVNGDTLTEGNETFFVNLSGATNATIADNQGLGTILTDDIPVIQFNAAVYTIDEGAVNTPEGFASLTVQVDRSGDLSGASTVRYATADLSGNNECTVTNGNASQRCDYLMLSGTLRFAAGESSKTFQIPIVNDGYVEGPEVFTIELSNVTGGTLGPASLTTVGITDDDTVATDSAHNPYLSNSFFVRMHYVDFLEREPDTAGFNDWVGVLDGCGPQQGFLGAPAGCDRAHISQGFFGATEFIDRGFLVYRLYDVGLNRLPLFTEFNPDAAELRGFGLTAAEQQQNLDNYLLELGARTEFVNRYAAVSATGQASQLIDLLETTAGVTLPATATTLPGQPPQYGRADLINKRATGQFSVVETVKAFVEQQVVYDKYFPRGFVTMQYFAYLHRDPDAAGWNDWLDVLVNGRPSAGIAAGDYRHLIFGFIYSTEYRKRFGQP